MWTFAQAVYSGPGIAQSLLQWQDEAGADVCVLLALLYAEHHGLRIDAETVRALDALTLDWRQNVVHPLRTMRRRLKSAGQADSAVEVFRSTIKDAELAAERRQLVKLAGALASLPPNDNAGTDVLRLYAEHLGVPEPILPELASWMTQTG